MPNLKPLSLSVFPFFFSFFFLHRHVKGLPSKRISLNVDVKRPENRLVRQCIFQLGNFTGWDSGGVNVSYVNHITQCLFLERLCISKIYYI